MFTLSLRLIFLGCYTQSGHRRSSWIAIQQQGLSLSELPPWWTVLWKILSGGDVQGHSVSPPVSLRCLYFLNFSYTFDTSPQMLTLFSANQSILQAWIFLKDRCTVTFFVCSYTRSWRDTFTSPDVQVCDLDIFWNWMFINLLVWESKQYPRSAT